MEFKTSAEIPACCRAGKSMKLWQTLMEIYLSQFFRVGRISQAQMS